MGDDHAHEPARILAGSHLPVSNNSSAAGACDGRHRQDEFSSRRVAFDVQRGLQLGREGINQAHAKPLAGLDVEIGG